MQEGVLTATVGFTTVEALWGSKVDASLQAELRGGNVRMEPSLTFTGGITYTSRVVKSATWSPVVGRLERDGDNLTLVLCLQAPLMCEDAEEIATIAKAGVLVNGLSNGGQCLHARISTISTTCDCLGELVERDC